MIYIVDSKLCFSLGYDYIIGYSLLDKFDKENKSD